VGGTIGGIIMLTEQRKTQIIELCQELVKIRSYSGEEGKLVNKIKEAFLAMGYDDFYIDSYGNIVGHIKGKGKGAKILFDGHMDTVPVVDETVWKHNPFSGEIEAGKLYGRGASDMKGAIASMICAGAFFAEDTGKNFMGDIYVAGVVHEECFEGIAARNISKRIKPDYVVIGEASECNLKIGQRGRAEIVLETFGKPAHSANPQEGINAVNKITLLINEINKLKVSHDDFLGDGILELTDIKSSPYPGASVVPDYCKATYDRRLLVGEEKEEVLKPIEEIIERFKKEDEKLNAKVSFAKGQEKCFTGEVISGERFFPAWKYSVEDKFVKATFESIRNYGIDAIITHYSFCTNGSHYAGEAGIRTLGFGPSKESLAHTVDEYVEIEQLYRASLGYYAIIDGLLKE
jgi:putative selenium metabolism hydrolase